MSMSSLKEVYETQIKSAIYDYGRTIKIVYASTATCNSCGYDPINKESTNVTCSTCSGQYYYQTETNLFVKGVVYTFLGNMRFQDYALQKIGLFPDTDARLTCWLTDVLVNEDSATGSSYLDVGKNIRIESGGIKYQIETTQRTGFDTLTVIVCGMKEIK